MDFDVLIVGAGLSGIGAAFHLQDKCPSLRYAILEGRSEIGGTWDLFRYPGVRSDSDMHTLGYSFHPWKEARAIADGPAILRYIKKTAETFGIDQHILLAHRVTEAMWSTQSASWTVTTKHSAGEEPTILTCHFLILCSGYYDFDEGYTPTYPGLEAFRGEFLHPQRWNEATQYGGKNVVVIGSGATAVTLVPELAKQASQVVMLQRSPSYLSSLPSVDASAVFLRKYLPDRIAHRLIRWKNILIGMAFFRFCRRFPDLARRVLLNQVRAALRGSQQELKDFLPNYQPWDQRICFVPDGDFFRALQAGRAEVVTGTIDCFTETGIRLHSGRVLPADLVVSATGLKLKFLGGIQLRVDGRVVDLRDTIPYKGAMLGGIPNLGMAFGYTNASWTLKCDLACDWLARVINYMKRHGHTVVVPQDDPAMERVALIDFSSGYFQRAKDILPKQGKRAPWKLNQNYFSDLFAFRFRPLADRGLKFSGKVS